MSLNLTAAGLADQKAWEAAGYALPSYDREAMITRTKESPCWVHFGAGNIFRAFQANAAQELLNNGTFDRGVIVAEGFDTEIIRDMYQPHDNLSILVTLKADGSVEKTVVGSIAESLAADTADSPDFARLKEIFTKDSLQMATFTITEKGYSLKNGAGELLPSVAADFAAGPSSVTSYMGKVASLLYERFLAGEKPVAMVSTDNCSHNGEKLSLALTAYASAWEENKLVQPGFLSYLQNPEKVSFPWTMIDKITRGRMVPSKRYSRRTASPMHSRSSPPATPTLLRSSMQRNASTSWSKTISRTDGRRWKRADGSLPTGKLSTKQSA